jgi:endonuclease/exonuclease/phosphatase family metal-dependent hydrolase
MRGPELSVLSYNVRGLRGDLGAMTSAVRAANPDVVVIQEGPRRLRWRTKSADLGNRFGLLYAGGGLPSLGNLVLVSFRVSVHEAWYVQYPLIPGRLLRGAVLVRCSVAGAPFVVVGTQLTPDPEHRPAQAAILATVLSDVDEPVVMAADVNDVHTSVAWRLLAQNRTEVGDAPLFVDPHIEVDRHELLDTVLTRRASAHLPITARLHLPEPK